MTAINTIGKSDVMGRDGFTWWVGEVEDKRILNNSDEFVYVSSDGTLADKVKKHICPL